MTQREGSDPVAPVPERILAAAAELIEQGGWSGITMTKVAALAGFRARRSTTSSGPDPRWPEQS